MAKCVCQFETHVLVIGTFDNNNIPASFDSIGLPKSDTSPFVERRTNSLLIASSRRWLNIFWVSAVASARVTEVQGHGGGGAIAISFVRFVMIDFGRVCCCCCCCCCGGLCQHRC